MAAVPVPIPPADDAPHLLVVDDDRRIRDLLSRFLSTEGYRITHRRQRGDGARQAVEPELRSADPRRDDAGRDRLRVRASRHPQDLGGADPDADRARRRRKPHHRARDRRRRLCRQAVRAARAVAAHRQHPQARQAGRRAAGGVAALRAVRVSHRRAASCAAARRSSASPTASARCCACSPRRRARPCRALALAGDGGSVNERAVDVQVNRLRRKIERDPANPLFVQTVRGIGYRLVASP